MAFLFHGHAHAMHSYMQACRYTRHTCVYVMITTCLTQCQEESETVFWTESRVQRMELRAYWSLGGGKQGCRAQTVVSFYQETESALV